MHILNVLAAHPFRKQWNQNSLCECLLIKVLQHLQFFFLSSLFMCIMIEMIQGTKSRRSQQ